MKSAERQERQLCLLSAPDDSGPAFNSYDGTRWKDCLSARSIGGERVELSCWPFPVTDCMSYSSDSRKHCLLSTGVNAFTLMYIYRQFYKVHFALSLFIAFIHFFLVGTLTLILLMSTFVLINVYKCILTISMNISPKNKNLVIIYSLSCQSKPEECSGSSFPLNKSI